VEEEGGVIHIFMELGYPGGDILLFSHGAGAGSHMEWVRGL